MYLGVSGSVRLTGGLVPQQGYVETCVDGIWTRVCGESWSNRNSFVTCRQLNYPTSELSELCKMRWFIFILRFFPLIIFMYVLWHIDYVVIRSACINYSISKRYSWVQWKHRLEVTFLYNAGKHLTQVHFCPS